MKKLLLLILLVALVAVIVFGCTTEEAFGAGVGIFMIICYGIMGIIGLLLFILWIITIVDCAKRNNDEFPDGGDNMKIVWLLLIILLGYIPSIVYYFMVMRKMPGKK
ncbi:MAG: PLDc N-terminal domain-containing protein [Actinomycetia bacterium]|nr:PLDc N-terminal domain-containing protein [Actinomycetes bacterium]